MSTSPITRGISRATRRPVTVDGVERQLFVASTDIVDRCDDIVDQATWKLDNYNANPIVLVDHDYEAGCVVGRGSVVVVEGVGLVLDVVKWSRKAFAQDIMNDVEDGIISAVSVGFSPGRVVSRRDLPEGDPRKSDGYGCVYFDCDLLEVSIVAVPANPEALAVRAAHFAPDADAIAGSILDLLATDPNKRAMLRDLLAEPEPADLSHLFPDAPKADGLIHLFSTP